MILGRPDSKTKKVENKKPPSVADFKPAIEIQSTQDVNRVIEDLELQTQMEWGDSLPGIPPVVAEHYVVAVDYNNDQSMDSNSSRTSNSSSDEMEEGVD